jgi:hypothetical protein
MTGTAGQGGAAPGTVKRGGPPPWFALVALASLAFGVVLVVAQLAGIRFTGAPAATTPEPAGAAAQRTAGRVRTALEAASFQVREPQVPFRPGESPGLVDVPRSLLQAILPGDPDGGYVVIYELPGNTEAETAGRDFTAWLAGGTGAIQYPRDAQFVIRRVGSTLVFFPWSPTTSTDPRTAEMAATLETLGLSIRP